MAFLTILSPGLHTTIQDCGRYGFQRFGMPVSGAMDTFSLRLANILVGNHPNQACLEVTLLGPEIAFSSPGAIAICGANMNPSINNRIIPLNKTIEVRSGDILRFSGLVYGFRSYLAFAGGIDLPLVMGSRSTYIRARVGGLQGRAIVQGDTIPLGKIDRKIRIRKISSKLLPIYQSNQKLRVIAGPEVKSFGFEGIRNFLTSGYEISNQSDRMGYRLTGPIIKHSQGSADIISAATSMGTIQVPGDGQPIILMADRQTTGGYTRLANVISADLTLAAQLKPGDKIHFEEISLEKAQDIFISQEKMLESLKSH